MLLVHEIKKILIFLVLSLVSLSGLAGDDLFVKARELQREGKYDEAIGAFRSYLLQPVDANKLSQEQTSTYTDALMQLMNTYQCKGEPEACVVALKEIQHSSPILKKKNGGA